jgi:hypothetical protein
MWFHNPELFDQLLEPSPVVTATLTASVQIFHQQLHGSVEKLCQTGDIAINPIVIEIASEFGIQLLEQLW